MILSIATSQILTLKCFHVDMIIEHLEYQSQFRYFTLS